MADDTDRPDHVIPVLEERLTLGTRTVETDRVRVRTVVEERPETISALLKRGMVEVERVPAFREVLTPPPPREQDGVVIISVVEERLVKRSFVVEEVHVRARTVAEEAQLSGTVRVMRAEVERPPTADEQERESDV